MMQNLPRSLFYEHAVLQNSYMCADVIKQRQVMADIQKRQFPVSAELLNETDNSALIHCIQRSGRFVCYQNGSVRFQ